MKRKRYDLDKKMYDLIKNHIETFEIINDICVMNHVTGRLCIDKNCIEHEDSNLKIALHEIDEFKTSYEFSPEYSKKVREFLINILDDLDVKLKESNTEIEEYIIRLEAKIKKTTEKFFEELEQRIIKAKESGEKSIVAYSTQKSDYNDNLKSYVGFGVHDLKPQSHSIYSKLLMFYGKKLDTLPVNISELRVNFIVNF